MDDVHLDRDGPEAPPSPKGRWLSVHRRGARVLITSVAVLAFTVLAMAWGARWAEALGPAGDPVLRVTAGWEWTIAAGVTIAIAAIVRALITDANLRSRNTAFETRRRDAESRLRATMQTAPTLEDHEAVGARLDRLLEERATLATTAALSRAKRTVESRHSDNPPRRTLLPWRRDDRSAATDRAVQQAITLAARSAIAPASVFTRVSERRLLEDEHASVTLTRTIEGSAPLSNLVLVPVLQVPKGTLVGAMKVTVDERAGRTLTMVAGRGILIDAFEDWVAALVADGLATADQMRECLAVARRWIVADTAASAAERGALLGDFDEAVGFAERAGRTPRQRVLLQWARSLLDTAIAADVIFAIVSEGCAKPRRITVGYEEPYRKPISGIRRLVGIGRSEFSIDLRGAADADTYHLDIRADPSTYFEEAIVVYAVEPPPPVDTELIWVAPLRGDAQAHVYARAFGSRSAGGAIGAAMPESPKVHIRMRERPPGLIGATFALSLWIFLLTWVICALYPALFPILSGAQTVWMTLVLAAPALVTGWLLSRLNADAVRHMSMSAFALIVWLSIDVVAVVTVSALSVSGAAAPAWTVVQGALELHHPEWAMLAALTLSHLCASALLFVGRGVRYSRTIDEGASS